MLRKPVVALAPAIMVSSLAMTLVAASTVTQVSMGARAAILDRFLAPEQQPLVSYRAIRRLTASTRGGRMQASIEAWTTLDPTEGFKYEVTAEEPGRRFVTEIVDRDLGYSGSWTYSFAV